MVLKVKLDGINYKLYQVADPFCDECYPGSAWVAELVPLSDMLADLVALLRVAEVAIVENEKALPPCAAHWGCCVNNARFAAERIINEIRSSAA